MIKPGIFKTFTSDPNRRLTVIGTSVGATLEYLRGKDHLVYLELTGTRVTDETIGAVAALKGLESLSLSNTRITDKGLVKLAELPRLQSLWLRGTAVTQDGFGRYKDLLVQNGHNIPWIGN